MLTGEVNEFGTDSGNGDEVDLVSVSVVDSCLYVGALADYELDGKGNLARLTLEQVYRRKLNSDALDDDNTGSDFDEVDLASDERYYRIKGDSFLIDCDKVRNLNIDYWYLADNSNQ